MRAFLLVLCILSGSTVFAQRIEGRIIDAETHETLPFVHITGKNSYALSNIQGYYSIDTSNLQDSDSLTFSLIGYEKASTIVASLNAQSNVRLTRKTFELNTFTVVAKEDPAYAMIRKAVDRKKLNDPENLETYQYYSYNKAYADVIRTDSIQSELANSGFANAHIFMMETATKVRFEQPNKYKEEVLANRVSGFKNPSLVLQSNSFQPFSTYNDFVEFLGFQFLNPISKNSDATYVFQLMDSVQTDDGLAYIIAFQPRKNKVGNLLEGTVTLNASDWAIVNLQLSNSGGSKIADFEVRQHYKKQEGRWFPDQSNTQYKFNAVDDEAPLIMVSNTYIDSVRFEKSTGKGFGIAEVEMRTPKTKISDADWNNFREVPLSIQEGNTYKVYDTLDTKVLNAFDWMMSQANSFARKSFALGAADIMLPYLLRFNQYEGIRLGLGVATNERFIKWLRPEAYFGYGLRDKTLKFGSGLRFLIDPDRDFEFSIYYRSDVDEPGRSDLRDQTGFLRISEIERQLFIRRMNEVESYKASLSYRPVRGLKTTASFEREERFFSVSDPFSDAERGDYQVITSQVGILFEYNPNERLMKMGNTLLHRQVSYPRFQLEIKQAIPEVFDSEQDFTRMEFRMAHRKNWRRIGPMELFASAGLTLGSDINEAHLFLSRGILGERNLGILAFGYFHTMPLYRFLNDRYLHLGFSQSLGTLFNYDVSYSRPELKIMYQAAIGGLEDNLASIENTGFEQMNHAYLEGGLIIDNILRLNQTGYYAGFGIGVFAKHGFYYESNFSDNLAYALSFAVSF